MITVVSSATVAVLLGVEIMSQSRENVRRNMTLIFLSPDMASPDFAFPPTPLRKGKVFIN